MCHSHFFVISADTFDTNTQSSFDCIFVLFFLCIDDECCIWLAAWPNVNQWICDYAVWLFTVIQWKWNMLVDVYVNWCLLSACGSTAVILCFGIGYSGFMIYMLSIMLPCQIGLLTMVFELSNVRSNVTDLAVQANSSRWITSWIMIISFSRFTVSAVFGHLSYVFDRLCRFIIM